MMKMPLSFEHCREWRFVGESVCPRGILHGGSYEALRDCNDVLVETRKRDFRG